MSFLRRFFSREYRRAEEAEAAGDLAQAALLFGRCGEPIRAVRLKLLGIDKSAPRERVVAELRSAAELARRAPATQEVEMRALLHAIAQALLREARRDAPTAPVDESILREAGEVFASAQEDLRAAECFESLGDLPRAAELYGRAGDLTRMESLLDREQARSRAGATLREAWDRYELALAAGQRGAALRALELCAELAPAPVERAEYAKLRSELFERLLTSGHTTLRAGAETKIYAGAFPVWLGRDGTSGLTLRDHGISRRHAKIDLVGGVLRLEDCQSRNGTRLSGIGVGDAPIPLPEQGEIALGDACALRFETDRAKEGRAAELRLTVTRGVDRGLRLLARSDPFELAPGVTLTFDKGAPRLKSANGAVVLNGKRAGAEVELARGDRVEVAGAGWEVL